MRWLARIFANAIARRVAYVVVAIALAWCGIGPARAQMGVEPCTQGTPVCTRAEAYAACMAHYSLANAWYLANTNQELRDPWCTHNEAAKSYNNHANVHRRSDGVQQGQYHEQYSHFHNGCPDGGTWDEETKTCGTCAEKPALGPGGWSGVTSSMMMCRESCEFEGGSALGDDLGLCFADGYVIDGVKYIYCSGWSPTGNSCTLGSGGFGGGEPGQSPSDSDGDGTSDGNDGSPNNPGQGGGGGENGEGQPEDGSGTCGDDGQPACGSPGTGSGNGNTSGGGGDCNTPPSSTGDAILAQIAYQTWATRCAITGTGNAGPGGGNGNGNGSGDGTGGDFDGDAEGRDAAKEGESEDPEREDVVEESETEEPELDTSGYGYSRACVAAPTVTVFGQTITFDTGPMCQWLELASYFVLVLAGLASARIINGGMS